MSAHTSHKPKSLRVLRHRSGVTWRYLRHAVLLTLLHGPKRLVTSRISDKCAAMTIALCSPALLCSAVLTLPALVFQSPGSGAGYQFARVLEHDPTRWIAWALSLLCAVLSLAVPATMPARREPSLY